MKMSKVKVRQAEGRTPVTSTNNCCRWICVWQLICQQESCKIYFCVLVVYLSVMNHCNSNLCAVWQWKLHISDPSGIIWFHLRLLNYGKHLIKDCFDYDWDHDFLWNNITHRLWEMYAFSQRFSRSFVVAVAVLELFIYSKALYLH